MVFSILVSIHQDFKVIALKVKYACFRWWMDISPSLFLLFFEIDNNTKNLWLQQTLRAHQAIFIAYMLTEEISCIAYMNILFLLQYNVLADLVFY